MELFKASGRIYREGNELFAELGWLQVMFGQGLTPSSYHSLVDAITNEQLQEYMENVKTIVAKAATPFPSQNDYISKHCAASK